MQPVEKKIISMIYGRGIGLERARRLASQRIGGLQRGDGSEPAPSIEHVHLLAQARGIALDQCHGAGIGPRRNAPWREQFA